MRLEYTNNLITGVKQTMFFLTILIAAYSHRAATAAEDSAGINAIPMSSESALGFRSALYRDVLLQNFKVTTHSWNVPSVESLRALRDNPHLLKIFLGNRLNEECLQAVQTKRLDCHSVEANLAEGKIVRSQPEAAGNDWANWLFAIDGENWIKYENLVHLANEYFRGPRTLYMVRGFDPQALFVSALSTLDLPVVFDEEERTITIWTAELFD